MKSDIENRDWLNDYMSLKQITPGNPFTVPAGYFDELGHRIVSYKNLDQLKDKQLTDGFTVPENYFEELTGNIQSRIVIGKNITSGELGFSVPEGYFNELEKTIKSRIFVEEAITNEERFTVPAGYFDQLSEKILAKTVEADRANRRGIIRKMFATTAVKYATAACFALVIGGGILISQLTNPAYVHKNSFLHKQLSNVPIDEIKDYLKLNVDAGDAQQTVVTEGTRVNSDNLKKALQDYADSVQ
ncbi:MAG: hypothetical protein M3N14_01000 [Bacteroidota bacterium]|nr:hypothetical protein [Bacteroidota bacterium]